MMNKKTTALSLIISMVTLNIALSNNQTLAAHKTHHSHAQYLFVQQAKGATITPEKNTWHIRIKQLQPTMIFFSDAPQRRAGNINAQSFINIWKTAGRPHINLAIEGHHANHEMKLALTLQSISFSSPQTFKIIAEPITHCDIGKSTTLTDVNIFIDGLPCGDAC